MDAETTRKIVSAAPDSGLTADSPWQMPMAAWKAILARTYKRTWDDNVGLVAAGVAFYSFFALVSLLGIIVLVYGLVAQPETVVGNFRTLTQVLPSDIALLIADQLMNAVRTSQEAKGMALLAAVAAALYGGTNGAAALITALNIAYEEKEKRSLGRFYLLAITMTLGAVVVGLGAVASTAALSALGALLPAMSGSMMMLSRAGAYLALFLGAAALASTLYRYAPSREQARWRWITPGSVLAAGIWLLLTALFSFYVSNLTSYSATYGSLGALAALQTWLYLSAYILVIGAELNSEIEHQTARDSTTGRPEPMGERGAWAADNVATTEAVEDRPEEAREGAKLTGASPTIADDDAQG